jgi:hypothetical protein
MVFSHMGEQPELNSPPHQILVQTINFSRSFLTFRIDALKKPVATVSHPPPYSLNNARILID